MTTKVKQFVIPFRAIKIIKSDKKLSFFQLAQKNIVKGKQAKNRNLSKQVDEIAYGI